MKASKAVFLVFLIMMSLFVVNIQPVKSQSYGTIYIRSDGGVEGTNMIQRDGDNYTFTNNIEDSIVIEASNIVLYDAGFILHGGIMVEGNNVVIEYLKINAPETAIEVYGSGCSILENEIQAEDDGIRFRSSDNNVVSGNKIDRVRRGIVFQNSNSNVVKENSIISRRASVEMDGSNYNIFSGNNVSYISTEGSCFNTFTENNLPQGFLIRNYSNYNNITGNNIIDFDQLTETYVMCSGSILIEDSAGNLVSSNKIVNSGGILLHTSSKNVLKNNIVNGDGLGFEVSGRFYSSFINDVDDSNRINDKKIYYLVGKSDLSITPSTYPRSAYLGLVNCTRILVQNMSLNVEGILLAGTTESIITKNNISNCNGDGVNVNYASNINISRNIINANSGAGIALSFSNQTHISGNFITKNRLGIDLTHSENSNVITENNIFKHEKGVNLYFSSNNQIIHNNLINNTEQVYDEYVKAPFFLSPSENIWDNGYPVGGNYWGRYPLLYPDAEELNSSGIWDTPYIIDEYNQDRYPLMNPVEIPQPEIPLIPEAPDIPIVSVISPENRTYTVNNVSLTFKVSEPTSWIGYSLDGQSNVTVTGNTTLNGLSNGVHNLTVYADDFAGNTGASETISFTVAQPSEPFPITWIVAAIAIIVVAITTSMFYVIRKRKK